MEQLSPGGATYNEATALRLRGPLDQELLARGLREVVGRHEILRTRITVLDDAPVQEVLADAAVTPFVESVASLPLQEREGEALRRVRHLVARPFDLACAPLLRVHLVALATDDHILCITIHHIVSDGWSLRILLDELAAAYAALRAGQRARLPVLPIQYADYARWQREEFAGTGQVAYWREQLHGAPQVLDLPTDHPRPHTPSAAGGKHAFTLPTDLVRELTRLGRAEGATLFMVLLAAFQVLLARYSGQDEVVVGTPVANRTRTETERLIGCFVNTLVLRTALHGETSFRSLLGQVKATVLAAFAHQDVPFERLVEELRPERQLGRNPLFQAMFVLHNAPFTPPALPALTVTPIGDLADTAKVDLTLAFVETPTGLAGQLEYSSELFEPATIERLAGHLRELLTGTAADPDRPFRTLALLTEDERRHLLTGWRRPVDDTTTDRLDELFDEQVARDPAAVAVVDGERRISYGDLAHRVDDLAARLLGHGVCPGTLVALCLERSAELVVAVLAVLKAGGAYVPLDPAEPTDRLRLVLDDAGPPLLVTQEQLVPRLPHRESTVVITVDDRAPTAPTPSRPRGDASDLAYAIYTSGSTGRPKGVLVEHRQVVRLLQDTKDWFRFSARDVWTLFHSYTFDVSVWEMFGALLHGGRLVIVPHPTTRSPEAVRGLLVTEQVTVLCQTPTAFAGLIAADRRHGRTDTTLRLVVLAGERLDFRMLAPWFERHPDTPEVVNMLGPTETAVYATHRPVRRADTTSPHSYVGGPLPHVRLLVVDRHLQPVPVGVPGELLIGGAGVARGYLNRPELDADRFIPAPHGGAGTCYRTGDLVRWAADGDLEYLGRMDDQVKVRGFRIELGEVEEALRAHPRIRDVVVSVAPDGSRLVAHVVGAESQSPPVHELRAFLRTRLPEYMLPSAYAHLAELPLTTSGKVDRQALPPARDRQAGAGDGYVAPRGETERLLAAAWAELLDMDRIGVEDNFFELGGHSVLAVHLHQRLHGTVSGFEVIDVFQYPTIRGLAAHIARKTADTAGLDRVRARAKRRRTARDSRSAPAGETR